MTTPTNPSQEGNNRKRGLMIGVQIACGMGLSFLLLYSVASIFTDIPFKSEVGVFFYFFLPLCVSSAIALVILRHHLRVSWKILLLSLFLWGVGGCLVPFLSLSSSSPGVFIAIGILFGIVALGLYWLESYNNYNEEITPDSKILNGRNDIWDEAEMINYLKEQDKKTGN